MDREARETDMPPVAETVEAKQRREALERAVAEVKRLEGNEAADHLAVDDVASDIAVCIERGYEPTEFAEHVLAGLRVYGWRIVKFADWVTEEDLMDLIEEEL